MKRSCSIFTVAFLSMSGGAMGQTTSQQSSDFQKSFLSLGLATVTAAIADGVEAAKGQCPSVTGGEFSKATGRLKQLRDENFNSL